MKWFRQKIASAATQAGRDPENIELIAVTKYVDAKIIELLYQAGCRNFGESRPQALWQKAEELSALEIRWHLIGHLQRNKVARTIPLTSLLHSVDSIRLLKEIDSTSENLDLKPTCC